MPFLNPGQTVIDLRQAAAFLTDKEWIKGYDTMMGAYCAFGAIRQVVGDLSKDCSTDTRDRASNAARAFYRVKQCEITSFNDADSRTKTEVIEALLMVADAIEKDPRHA